MVDFGGNKSSGLDLQQEAHRYSDVDRDKGSQHHTLGKGPTQASPGNHNHDEDYVAIQTSDTDGWVAWSPGGTFNNTGSTWGIYRVSRGIFTGRGHSLLGGASAGGQFVLVLPVALRTGYMLGTASPIIGTATAHDPGNTLVFGHIRPNTLTQATVYSSSARNENWTNLVPFTFGINDEVSFSLSYPVD